MDVSSNDQGAVKTKKQPDEIALSQFERYEIQVMLRTDLKTCPYNPREIGTEEKRKLKGNLKKRGLLQPLVFNGRSGRLISGHQRLACLDDLEGRKNYKLRLAVVDLSDKEEKEQVVFFNNQEAMGVWSLPKLNDLFKNDKIGIEESGFDVSSIYRMLGDAPLIAQPDKLLELAEKIRASQREMDDLSKEQENVNDANFFTVLVFDTQETRNDVHAALDLPHTRWIDGRIFMRQLGMYTGQAYDEENMRA
jgi:hypothetical protein